MDPAYFVSILAAAVAALFAALTKLQYDALKYRDEQITELKTELKDLNSKVQDTVKAGNEATRQQLAEVVKTNAELVAALTKRDGSG
jgi:hypothetical protein